MMSSQWHASLINDLAPSLPPTALDAGWAAVHE
jgi:hypothetical protein